MCPSRMAELSLLPAVRKSAQGDILVADGTSCRHQIKDGTGREAVHVAGVGGEHEKSTESRESGRFLKKAAQKLF